MRRVSKALKLDLPYPVLPKTAICLVSNLSMLAKILTDLVLESIPNSIALSRSFLSILYTIFKKSDVNGTADAPRAGNLQSSETNTHPSISRLIKPIA